jgi:hypothetical protein
VLWAVRLFWVVPLSFYWYTACRGTGWIDAPMIAYHVSRVSTGTWVNNHNLFHILGRAWSFLFPVGDLHYSLNLFCGLCGAITVYCVFLSGWRITKNLYAALLGAVALMLSHSLWWHSTMLEVYTLNSALMALMLYFVVRYDETGRLAHLYKAVFCLGLGLSNHVLMGLLGPAFVVLFSMRSQWKILWRPRVLGTVLFFFVMGFQIYLVVFIKDYARLMNRAEEQTYEQELVALRELADEASGGRFKDHMFPDDVSASRHRMWRLDYVFTLFMNYPSLAFLLGGVGVLAAWRRKRFRLSLGFFTIGLLVQAIWSSNYLIWDMYAFGLPVWVLFGLLVILGADHLWRAGGVWRRALLALAPTLLIPPLLYAQVVVWAQHPGFWKRYFSMFSFVENLWDPALYFANPSKRHYDEADRMAGRVFDAIAPDAHLFDSDSKGFYPFGLYYQKVLGRRPDIDFHKIFGPTLDDEKALKHAKRMKGLLEEGKRVYVSSPNRPERSILDALFVLIKQEQGYWPRDVRLMSVEMLEKSFPRYDLRRVQLNVFGDRFIYEIVPKSAVNRRR